MKVTRSRTMLPILSETGGKSDGKSFARVVCGANGEALKPVFTHNSPCANGDHALFVVRRGMHIVVSDGQQVKIQAIVEIGSPGDRDALLLQEIVAPGDEVPEEFYDAAEAAMLKANCADCKSPHYIAYDQPFQKDKEEKYQWRLRA